MTASKRTSPRKILWIVIIGSVALHLVAGVVFGTFKIVQSITREEQTFEAPPIEEVPQQEPEYVVNLEQRNQSSAPPRPNPIVVESPDVSIPSLNIDLEVANTSVYGRGSGGLGGGGSIREMAINSIDFFGQKFAAGDGIVFVIDMSGSMVMQQRGRDGYRAVVREVIETLKKLPLGTQFNLVAFAGDTETFKSFSPTLNSITIEQAEKWLMIRDPGGALDDSPKKPDWNNFRKGVHMGTRVDLALTEAFSQKPSTVILLSDGEPTGKKEDEIFKIVSELQNEVPSPVTINTLSYKSKNGRKFLEKLAKENKGTYNQVN